MFKLLGSLNRVVDLATNFSAPPVKLPNINVNVRSRESRSFWIQYPEGRVYYDGAVEALEDLMQRYNELADAYDDLLAQYESGQ